LDGLKYRHAFTGNAPVYFSFLFKRFYFDSVTRVGKKIHSKVSVPLDIRIYGFEDPNGTKYFLQSVIFHQGKSMHGGHYFCLNRVNDDVYIEMNDKDTRTLSKNEVIDFLARNCGGTDINQFLSPYLLIYVKEDKKKVTFSEGLQNNIISINNSNTTHVSSPASTGVFVSSSSVSLPKSGIGISTIHTQDGPLSTSSSSSSVSTSFPSSTSTSSGINSIAKQLQELINDESSRQCKEGKSLPLIELSEAVRLIKTTKEDVYQAYSNYLQEFENKNKSLVF
jgi:hypothetical protein